MSLVSEPREFPCESPAPAPVIEHDQVQTAPVPGSPESITHSSSSTLSQSPSNFSCFSAGNFNPDLRHTDHIMDPINVHSHPHESNPLVSGTPGRSHADAAHKLQQLLRASGADGAVEQFPEPVDDVGSLHSTASSLKFAKGIVSGLFRANRSVPVSGNIPPAIGEIYHHFDEFGTQVEQTANATPIAGTGRRLFSPLGVFQKPNMTPPKLSPQVSSPIVRGTDTAMARDSTPSAASSDDEQERFSVFNLVRRSREKKASVHALMSTSGTSATSVVTQIHTPLDGGEDCSPTPGSEVSTSPGTLTPPQPQHPCQTQLQGTFRSNEATKTKVHGDQEGGRATKKGETESIRSWRSSFSIPARSIIRQGSSSSVLDKTPSTKDTREFHSKRGRKSGVDALTSALTSPNYKRKITSLTPPGDYKLPNLPGYVSFPPYIPSSGLALLFGNGEDTWQSLKRFPSFRTKKGTNVVESILEAEHGKDSQSGEER